MPDITLRTAVTSDLPFLWEMLYEAAFVPDGTRTEWRAQPVPPKALSKYVDGWGRAGDAGLIAEEHGVPIGAAWYRLFPQSDAGDGVIALDSVPEFSIALDRAHRGRGIGHALLAALMQQARGDGYAEMVLSVAPENADAIRLYERLGFRDAYPNHPTAGTSRYMCARL